jgi:hypothetical protein
MGEFSKWLMHDDQKDLFEFLFALTLSLLFLVLIALLLWPLGKPMLAFRLAKGYGYLWGLLYLVSALVSRIQAFFRVNLYDHADAYVNSNLAVSCLLLIGWSAFAALTVHSFIASVPIWLMVILYLVGFFSCLVAFIVVASFYQGHIYKMISLPLALVCFIVFSVWPASVRLLGEWFFELF